MEKKSTSRAKRPGIRIWFVRCPNDDASVDASWQPSMHPHIFHTCRTCKVNIGVAISASDSRHEIRQAEVYRRPKETIEAAMDRCYAEPTKYWMPS